VFPKAFFFLLETCESSVGVARKSAPLHICEAAFSWEYFPKAHSALGAFPATLGEFAATLGGFPARGKQKTKNEKREKKKLVNIA
jgi:hypothetical protein